MSRGPGRIERPVEAAFTTGPSRAFTVEDLVRIAYGGVNRVEKKHRVATLRAAHNVAKRFGWKTMKGGENGDGLTFYNPADLGSYAEARLRRSRRRDLRSGRAHGRERFERDPLRASGRSSRRPVVGACRDRALPSRRGPRPRRRATGEARRPNRADAQVCRPHRRRPTQAA